MTLETKKYLHDIRRATYLLEAFTSGKTFADYEADAMFRAAVEREFEIIGEAMSRLAAVDEATASRITNYQRIISFRNVLIHGYADVDNRLVWGVLEANLPILANEVEALSQED